MQTLSPLAGNPAPPELLVDVTQLERAYFDTSPDVEDPNQLVHFGTSGHRGSSLRASFNESPILAIRRMVQLSRIAKSELLPFGCFVTFSRAYLRA